MSSLPNVLAVLTGCTLNEPDGDERRVTEEAVWEPCKHRNDHILCYRVLKRTIEEESESCVNCGCYYATKRCLKKGESIMR